MFHPKDPRVQANLPKIKKALKDDNDLKVYITAKKELKDLIIAGTHPMVQGIPKSYVEVFLSENGLLIAKGMLYNWLSGKIDEKNAFVLERCDIKVVGTTKLIGDVLGSGIL